MSLIARQLKEYSTNRSAAFGGTRCFLLDVPIIPTLKYFEIAVGKNLEHYYFYACSESVNAPLIKRTIGRHGIDNFVSHNKNNILKWDEANTIEMDWSNPPKERMMAVVVQVRHGQPDFSAPALFMYVPEVVKKPRMKTRIKPLPKGNGPIPYRL